MTTKLYNFTYNMGHKYTVVHRKNVYWVRTTSKRKK